MDESTVINVENDFTVGRAGCPQSIDSFISTISRLLSNGEANAILACLGFYEGLALPAKRAKEIFPFIELFIAGLIQRELLDEFSVAVVSSLLVRVGYKSPKQVVALARLLIAAGRESVAADLLACALAVVPEGYEYFGALLSLSDGEAKHRAFHAHFECLRLLSVDSPAIAALYAVQLLLIGRENEALQVTAEVSAIGDPAAVYARIFALYWSNRWVEADALLISMRHPEGDARRSLIKLMSFFAKHKPIVQLARKMIAVRQEESAANLLAAMDDLFPLAPGYFNVILLLESIPLKYSLVASHFERLKILEQKNPTALALHAIQLVQIRRYAEAVELTAERETTHPEVLYSRVLALFWSDRFREASELLKKQAVSSGLSPKSVSGLASLGIRTAVTLADEERIRLLLQDAETRVLPLPKVDLVYANLAIGDYENAFRHYFDSDFIPCLRMLSDRVLDDECVTAVRSRQFKTCAVICSMGVGDEVRFASMLPEICRLFEKTVLYCDPRLRETLARSFPGLEVRSCDFKTILTSLKAPGPNEVIGAFREELAQYDLLCELKQFSYLLRISLDDFPRSGRHLLPNSDRLAKWKTILGELKKPVIGLFWGSRLRAYDASHKQSSLQDWIHYLPLDDILIIPLQYEMTEEEEDLISRDHRFLRRNLDFDLKNDLEETFALLAALPLVISTAGTTQHMAGAVGTRVLCPTHPFQARWRRLYGRHHEIWSPNVEIISGSPEDGLMGAVRLCIERLSLWLAENTNQPLEA